ncbi:MAG: asparagine synthase (glutamine-hydrolyzing) [Patescibacteria group bacterium]|nr:asparagine synthase (glutamine-hydrolyzing) [Patescibacteria group bacterium]
MCGIVGFTGKKNLKQLSEMVKLLTHRGPDEEGFYSDNEISLGIRRLSIIDLITGSQPIYNEDKSVIIIFNGEIYNFPDLKKELLKRGHRFYTKADTEVIVHLYEDFGENFVDYLDGMFAIALWDKKNKKLILCRDRFGKKPLYYILVNNNLIFGSEIKSILVNSKVKKRLNLEALHHYLSLKHIPSPLTIYQKIYSLPAASILIFYQRKIKIKKYWKLKYNLTRPKKESEIISNLEHLLKKAVEKRLIGDVPIGAYLSGGVDSSLVVALYSLLSGGKIKTFSLIYEDRFKNKTVDAKFARLVAKKYKTEHYEYLTNGQELLEDLVEIISAFDQPFAGVVSTYFISKLIKKYVKVAISGDGGDELFGSYLAARLAFPINNYLEGKRDSESLKPFDKEIDFLYQIAERPEWKWRAKLVVFNEEEKRNLYNLKLAPSFKKFNTEKLFQSYFKDSQATDSLNRILDVDCQSVLSDQVLPFVDRLSMAHSIEVRCPYLDQDFAEYVVSLPGEWKIRKGETKYILKRLAEKYLPKNLIYRPKEGFISPINQWLPNNKKYLKSVLSERNLIKHNLFNIKYVNQLVDNLKVNDTKSINKVWTLLNFQIWYENNRL